MISLIENFLAWSDASRFFDLLRDEIAWEQKPIVVFGKEHLMPRLVAWYGEPDTTYTYSGMRNTPKPWTMTLQDIRRRVEIATSATFNSVLLNLYRDGRDTVGPHSDDEPEVGPVIASVSLGAERKFVLTPKPQAEREKMVMRLGHGSLLVMSGDTQTRFKHSVPRELKIKEARINLTFRRIQQPTKGEPVR